LPNYGLVPEIITAAYGRKGYKVHFETMPWARVLLSVKKGIYDAAATAYFTEERAEVYFFSDAYMESSVVFYKRKDAPIDWKTLDDLRPYSIGVVRGNSYSPEFDGAEFLRKDSANSEIQSLRKLLAKRVDLVVMDQLVGNYLINKELPQHKTDLEIIRPPLYVNKLYLMFSRRVPDVQQKINAFNMGLLEISKNGTLKCIIDKYRSE
jgi:polar amino acid transport system substrate-binding protein